ncbi:DUF4148 domain-containing protein [Paraburkholderia dinghuensis]|uniref:DUF4148 domain-containing protein n=1 Tax=Paraburkholderia dinghuensis TaxID=2305225 RepID=A0A3N6MPA8_9BURK|nr:DUF4148 domain-containing protein [Paraburkholderia dinghuensis]RQH05448.1 DUF4148 domain-containing protein [Paraburkholderia dinghuensis]
MTTSSRIALASLVAACSVASASALAQDLTNNPQGPLTRAQVRADLIDWLQAGYDPLNWLEYPENAQRASVIVAQRRAERAAAGGAMQPMQSQ